MMRWAALCAAMLLAVPAVSRAQLVNPGPTPSDGGAPVSAAQARAAVIAPPLCSEATIPAGANIVNTAAETPFNVPCTLPAGTLVAGSRIRIDSRFQLGVAASLPTLEGRVYLCNTTSAYASATALASAVSAGSCVLLLDTGARGGLTQGSDLYGAADVSCTFQTATSVECGGSLLFQTGATVAISVTADSATSSSSPALALPWNVTTTTVSFVFSGDWSAASTASYIQMRQQSAGGG